ncbi:MAG: folate-binding protein [Terracidiphilus sp.]|nr:folate-binding protein [Terracidiphilus sp.]
MTDTNLVATTQATALTELLKSSASQLCAYRGVLTPRQFDAPEAETAALTSAAAVHDLGWMRRVVVRGEDRFRWLSGMVTNTVNDLFPNSGAWNLVLNAQGRIQGDLMVWRGCEEQSPLRRNPDAASPKSADRLLGTPFAGESELELEIAANQYEKLLAHLNHFIVMDDVELVPLDSVTVGEKGSETAVGLSGPLADAVLERVGLPAIPQPLAATNVEWNGWNLRILRGYGVLAPHYEFFLPSTGLAKLWSCLRSAGGVPVGSTSLEAFRIAEGIPAYGIDIAERDLPQETSQLRALHFNKGCYLGQEIVERIHARGSVHKHLRQLELTGSVPAAGTELTQDGGAVAGQITSAAELPLASGHRVFALGMIRGEAEIHNQSFTCNAGTATGTARILATPPILVPSESTSKSDRKS